MLNVDGNGHRARIHGTTARPRKEERTKRTFPIFSCVPPPPCLRGCSRDPKSTFRGNLMNQEGTHACTRRRDLPKPREAFPSRLRGRTTKTGAALRDFFLLKEEGATIGTRTVPPETQHHRLSGSWRESTPRANSDNSTNNNEGARSYRIAQGTTLAAHRVYQT